MKTARENPKDLLTGQRLTKSRPTSNRQDLASLEKIGQELFAELVADPTITAKSEIMSYLDTSRTSTPLDRNKVLADWNTFVSRKPTDWTPPDYHPEAAIYSRVASTRPKTAAPSATFKLNDESTNIIEELSTRPMSFNGYTMNHTSNGDAEKPSLPEFPSLGHGKPGQKIKTVRKVKPKKKAASASEKEITNQSLPTAPENLCSAVGVEKSLAGDHLESKLQKNDLLKKIVALGLQEERTAKAVPAAPQNSIVMSDMEINYRLAKQGTPLSDRYAKHGGKFQARLDAAMNDNITMNVRNAYLNKDVPLSIDFMSFTPSPFGGSGYTSRDEKSPLSLQTKMIKKKTLLAQEVAKRVTGLSQEELPPTPTGNKLAKPKSPVLPATAPQPEPQTKLSKAIRNAVTAIKQAPQHQKTYPKSDSTINTKKQPTVKPTATITVSPSLEIKTKKVAKAKLKKKLVKKKSVDNTSALKTISPKVVPPTLQQQNLQPSICSTSDHGLLNPPTPISSVSKSPSYDEFMQAQNQIIDGQWKHVLDRQNVLEGEVLQLLEFLQNKVGIGMNNNASDKPCCCDVEMKEKLSTIVRKQKEIIQLQVDLNQRYGFNHYGAIINIGRNQPILNAFEAHYGQLSGYVREMNGKTVYYCSICNYSVKEELRFRNHLESSAHVVRTYQGIIKHQPTFSCELCNEKFGGTTKYMNHVMSSDATGGVGPKCKLEKGRSRSAKPANFKY